MKKLLLLGASALMLACGHSTVHKDIPTDLAKGSMISGEILVDLKDNVSQSDVEEIEKIAGTTLYTRNPTAEKYKYEVGKVDPVKENEVLEKLNADPRVEHAEPMHQVKALWTPNDPMFGEQWGMTRVGAETAWNYSCGMGVKVAILDTGCSCYDDKGFIIPSDLKKMKCNPGYNFIDNSDFAAADHPHGQHVASTVAEDTNNGIGAAGLANCVSIMPVKVLSAEGGGSDEGVAEGIRWAADHGAQVINMSLGSDYPSDILEDAVNYAYDKGVVIIAAAGNSGGSCGFPAAYEHVIAVSALQQNDTLADFSSRGPQVAIAAPGKDILQQTIKEEGWEETYASYSGTSMACPHVSAAAALIVASGISKPDAVKEKLQSTADPKKEHNLYGAGVLRADRAVRSTFLSHLFTRALFLLGGLFIFRKRLNIDLMKNKLTAIGALLGGFGLMFPLLFTGILPRLGMFRMVGEALVRPLGDIDILMGWHNYLVLASAIPTTILAILLIGHSKAKLFVGGFAMGAGALAAQIAWSNDTNFALCSLLMRLVMVASVGVCVYFVRHVFDKK